MVIWHNAYKYINIGKQKDLHTNINKSYPEAALIVAFKGSESFEWVL